jgi:polo-like kinase 1
MNETLLKAGAGAYCSREGKEGARLPYVTKLLKTRDGIGFIPSNGVLQINCSKDHTKIIICPLMEAVTYIDKNQLFRYPFMYLKTLVILSYNIAIKLFI